MESPFPGMDPYLERSDHWESIHPQLVASLPALIEPGLPERYAISVEERVYLTVPGDLLRLRRPNAIVIDTETGTPAGGAPVATLPGAVEVLVPEEEPVREHYLTIRDVEAGDEVVTVIEVLSPTNKFPSAGRDEYMSKRGAVLSTRTNQVEIDLLRAGPRMPATGAPADYQYGILICRGADRPRAVLLPFALRDPIPVFPVPLRPGDPEPPVDLGPALAAIYRSNRLGQRIDYRRPPETPLSAEDDAWADALLREKGLR
jgi:hypothetical protein